MNRFIVLSFLVMGWGYYELSGGNDFVPETRPSQIAAATPAVDAAEEVVPVAAPAEEPVVDPLDGVTVVTRADTQDLDALPDPDSTANDAIDLGADSVADALAQALGEPVVNTGEPDPIPETETASAPVGNLREVTGDSVNLRDGPGTNFSVVDRLSRGTVINILESGPDGWVYVEVDGLIGWMSSDFLGPAI